MERTPVVRKWPAAKRGHKVCPVDPWCYLARAVTLQAFLDMEGEGRPDPGPDARGGNATPTDSDFRDALRWLTSSLCEGWLELGRIPENWFDRKLQEEYGYVRQPFTPLRDRKAQPESDDRQKVQWG